MQSGFISRSNFESFLRNKGLDTSHDGDDEQRGGWARFVDRQMTLQAPESMALLRQRIDQLAIEV